MAICKLCLKDKKLIDAHIIPRGFYDFLYPDEVDYPGSSKKSLMILRSVGKATNSQIGEYDQNILCAECDNGIGKYDDYAQIIFLRTDPVVFHESASKIENIDYKRLKLFFISLLWRASISSRDFFKLVDTGPFEDELRDMIIKEEVGSVNDFSLIFTRFRDDNPKLKEVINRNMTVPLPHKFVDGVNCYIFYFPNRYKVFIKVDKRPLPEGLLKISLQPNGTLNILDAGSFENSPEFKKMVEVANKDYSKSINKGK